MPKDCKEKKRKRRKIISSLDVNYSRRIPNLMSPIFNSYRQVIIIVVKSEKIRYISFISSLFLVIFLIPITGQQYKSALFIVSEENVEFDEALFEDLDDLDIEDE